MTFNEHSDISLLGKRLHEGVKEGAGTCSCKRTQCLKMYCECFAIGKICGD